MAAIDTPEVHKRKATRAYALFERTGNHDELYNW
jgi:hypothetical protein